MASSLEDVFLTMPLNEQGIVVEVFAPEQPFGGVQVEGAADIPVQLEINTGSPVASVFGRIGDIIAQQQDYAAFYAPLGSGLPPGGTPGQVVMKTSLTDYDAAWHNPATAQVSSVFGRIGAIVAQPGDYSAAQVTNAVSITGSYANPAWITSLAWAKITGAPPFEPALGNPATNGFILSSTAAGVRSWIAPTVAPVSSVFTRTGAVVAASGDYSAAQVTNAADVTAANTFAQKQTALNWESNDTHASYLGVAPALSTYTGLWFTSFALATAANYALAGATSGTFINAPTGGVVDMRVGNTIGCRLMSTGFAVGLSQSPLANTTLSVFANAAAGTPLRVRGLASQTGALQEWQNSAGTVLSSVSAAGVFTGNGSGLTNLNAEPPLGSPSTDGMVLSSTAAGVRSWITPSAAAPVSSVFTRTGAITAQTGDYTFAQIGSKPTTLTGYGITDAQPLDSDLTAIAALGTTSFGRGFLTQADAVSSRTYIGAQAAGSYEPALGNPSTDGYILSSTAAGVRSWIVPPSGGTPGGSTTQLQYNNAGVFGGAAALTYATSGTLFTAQAQAATDIPFVVKGAAGQSANLFQLQNSAGAVGFSFSLTANTVQIGGASGLLLNGTSLTVPVGGDVRAAGFGAFTVTNATAATSAAAKVPLAVKAFASQSANLQEWQNSAGTALSSISAAGVFTGSGAGLTGLPWSAITGAPAFEPALGNPSVNGMVLSSTTAGVRSWITPGAPAGQALTAVNDTNVTLSLGGTPATALLAAASLTLGWAGLLAVARGGTGVNSSTGTGSVVLSASPTFTGTATFATINPTTIGGNTTINRPVTIQGSNTNDSAAAGVVGETVTTATTSASLNSYTTGQTKSLFVITLGAGDWDLRGIITFTLTSVPGSVLYAATGQISTTASVIPDDGFQSFAVFTPAATATASMSCPLPSRRISLGGTTNVYLVGKAPTFASGTCGAFGYIEARRIR